MKLSGLSLLLRRLVQNKRGSFSKSALRTLAPSIRIFRNTKIQNRLISSFLILSVIPLLITGMYAYNQSRRSIKSKISTYSIQIAHQINKEIERDISDLTDVSENMVYSDYIQKSLSDYETAEDNQRMFISNNIIRYLTSQFPVTSPISEIRIVTNTGGLMSYERIYCIMSDSMEKLKRVAGSNEGIPGFAPVNLQSEQKGIALAREIYSVKTFNPLGYLFLTMVEDSISDIYRDIDLGEGAEIFILDANGLVVSSRNPEIGVNEPYRDPSILKGISEYRKLNKDTFTTMYKGSEMLVAYSYIKKADWYVVCTIPFSYLNSESSKIGTYTALVGLLCLLFSLILTYIITRSIAVPVRRLIRHMNEAKKGNLDVQINDGSRDEIGEVTINFNSMLEEIKKLISNIREYERQKATEKLKALQAQINPHFLSNTLNTVKWLANVQNADNISNLVTALIQLLQVSMGKGDELVTLATEIDYIRNYITIQEYKYCDKFVVRYDIEEGILNCKIPKFTIQPIVENAIIHGIEPMEGQGTIWIKAARSEGKIVLTVTDNGVGFPTEEPGGISDENSYTIKKKFSGFGIKNVDERIKLLFGEMYGISMESIPNMYTKVKIKIPEKYDNREES